MPNTWPIQTMMPHGGWPCKQPYLRQVKRWVVVVWWFGGLADDATGKGKMLPQVEVPATAGGGVPATAEGGVPATGQGRVPATGA